MTNGSFLLPLILGIPLLGALVTLLMPREEHKLIHAVGIAFSLITFAVSLGMFAFFNKEAGAMQLVFDKEWIPILGSRFKLGIDGISLWLVVLTTFLTPIVFLASTKAVTHRVREFVATILILEVGMLGAFVALDVFVFYVFWEIMLIPMYLLIGMWGGRRRLYASIKFVIYTMIGSLLMLAAILYVYVKYGQVSGEYTTELSKLTELYLPHSDQIWLFAAFALAFAIKIPLFPLHTWLPDAHVEAPTSGSVILAGVMLKFGIYGFIRFAIPLFPTGAEYWSPLICVLAVIGIIYGAFVAFAQDDVKKLIAYSSVSHLGFCALGLFAMTTIGIEGSIYAMLSHGLTTGGLFIAIGMLYERRHTRRLAEYGGIWKQMPIFAGCFLIMMLGSVGLPGLSGFVGEFLCLLGVFDASNPASAQMPAPKVFAAFATTGVIFGAVYLLYMFQKVMFGPLNNEANKKLPDLSTRERLVFVPLIVMIFFMGLYPKPFLSRMEPAVERFQRQYNQKRIAPDGPARLTADLPVTDPDEDADELSLNEEGRRE